MNRFDPTPSSAAAAAPAAYRFSVPLRRDRPTVVNWRALVREEERRRERESKQAQRKAGAQEVSSHMRQESSHPQKEEGEEGVPPQQQQQQEQNVGVREVAVRDLGREQKQRQQQPAEPPLMKLTNSTRGRDRMASVISAIEQLYAGHEEGSSSDDEEYECRDEDEGVDSESEEGGNEVEEDEGRGRDQPGSGVGTEEEEAEEGDGAGNREDEDDDEEDEEEEVDANEVGEGRVVEHVAVMAGEKPRRKRRKKMDVYDSDDSFIDDADLDDYFDVGDVEAVAEVAVSGREREQEEAMSVGFVSRGNRWRALARAPAADVAPGIATAVVVGGGSSTPQKLRSPFQMM